jgi:hypothetical protein
VDGFLQKLTRTPSLTKLLKYKVLFHVPRGFFIVEQMFLFFFVLVLVVGEIHLHQTHRRGVVGPLFGVSGVLKLQDYTRISHDTYYLSKQPHPHDKRRLVHGYAFLNLHRTTERRHQYHSHNGGTPTLIHRDKHHHFHRNLTTHESSRSALVASTHPRQKRSAPNEELPTCTGPISDGTAWRTSRGYYVHSQNRNGLSSAFITDALQRAGDAWHCGTARYEKLIEGPLLGIVDGASGETINLAAPDGVNEVGFASIRGHPGTVAVTLVWGQFDGPLEEREIVEFDMVFDGENYSWGDGGVNRSVMDLQSIATHETGHSYGLDDIYDGACNDVTMFGTSVEGEIDKRSLANNDLGGLSLLYGPLAPRKN